MLDVASQGPVLPVVKVKPRLRGTFHFFGFFAALFGLAEMTIAPVEGVRYVAGIVFAASLTLMLMLSAIYHRPMWSRAARNRHHVGRELAGPELDREVPGHVRQRAR